MARIATLTSGPADGQGGTDRHLGLMTEALSKAGHQVDHFNFEDLNPPRPWTLLDRLGFRHPGHGQHLYRLALAKPYRYDLIIANSFLGAYIPSGQPVINIFHSCDAAYADQTRPGLRWIDYFRQRWIWGYFEKRSARRHFSVAVSRSLQRELRHYYGVGSELLSCCVNTKLFCPGSRLEARARLGWTHGRPIVVFAGTWCYRKGADLFARLSQELSERADFLAISPPGLSDVPESPSVTYIRDIKADRMPLVFQAADLLVFPTRAESFGLVTAEAYSCCLPTITSEAGVGEEFRAQPDLRPFILDLPIRYDTLRSRLEQLLCEPELRQKVGHAGRAHVEQNYTTDSFFENLINLVDEFLAGRVQA